MQGMEGLICCGLPFLLFVLALAVMDWSNNDNQGRRSYERQPYGSPYYGAYGRRVTFDDSHRKSADCPKCGGPTKYRMSLHAGIENYLFFCDPCKLHFEYAYWDRTRDERKQLVIDAVCPLCKKDHKPYVVGKPDSYLIPCAPCWNRARKMQEQEDKLEDRARSRRSSPWVA